MYTENYLFETWNRIFLKPLLVEKMNDTDFNNDNYNEQRSRRRSLVWNFFEKISRQRVQCRLCKHEQNYQGTTGNILRHLKARHDLDATIKGQQNPKSQERIRELMTMTLSVAAATNIDQKPIILRKTSVTSDSSDTVDPYNDKDNKQMIFENGNLFCENIAELQEDCIYKNEKEEWDQRSEKKLKLEEDRILAETEYYREKAAYFRIQKHFTALQAKKVKLEIEQIILNNKNQT